MVINRDYQVEHSLLDNLGKFLRPGDLLVFNTSRTLPAVLSGCELGQGQCIEIRLAQHLADNSWLALLCVSRGILSAMDSEAECS